MSESPDWADEAQADADVADWPRLTPERQAEFRRLLLPAADRLRAAAAAQHDQRKSA